MGREVNEIDCVIQLEAVNVSSEWSCQNKFLKSSTLNIFNVWIKTDDSGIVQNLNIFKYGIIPKQNTKQ